MGEKVNPQQLIITLHLSDMFSEAAVCNETICTTGSFSSKLQSAETTGSNTAEGTLGSCQNDLSLSHSLPKPHQEPKRGWPYMAAFRETQGCVHLRDKPLFLFSICSCFMQSLKSDVFALFFCSVLRAVNETKCARTERDSIRSAGHFVVAVDEKKSKNESCLTRKKKMSSLAVLRWRWTSSPPTHTQNQANSTTSHVVFAVLVALRFRAWITKPDSKN